MKLQITTSPETNTIRLAGDLDIYSVEPAREALLDFLAARPEMEMDLREVETCDAAGMQILLAVRRSAVASGKTLAVHNLVPAIEKCRESLGLGPESHPGTLPDL